MNQTKPHFITKKSILFSTALILLGLFLISFSFIRYLDVRNYERYLAQAQEKLKELEGKIHSNPPPYLEYIQGIDTYQRYIEKGKITISSIRDGVNLFMGIGMLLFFLGFIIIFIQRKNHLKST